MMIKFKTLTSIQIPSTDKKSTTKKITKQRFFFKGQRVEFWKKGKQKQNKNKKGSLPLYPSFINYSAYFSSN